MARLNKQVKAFLKECAEAEMHYVSIAHRIRTNCEFLPSHFKDKPAEYYDGMRDINRSNIERLLMSHNKYEGFREMTSEDSLGNKLTCRYYYGDFRA